MKKKMLTTLLAAILVVSLSACGKDENKVPPSPSAEVTPSETPQTQDVLYSHIAFELSTSMENGTIKGEFSIENQNNEVMPLSLKDGNLISYQIHNEAGEVLSEKTIDEATRTKLQPKETITYNFSYDIAEEMTGEISVTAKLLLVDADHVKYDDSLLSAKSSVKIAQKLVWFPNEAKTYVYSNPTSESTFKESYSYFKDGLVQKNSELTGISVYSEDERGMYLVHSDPNQIVLDAPNVLENFTITEKHKWLNLPISVGDGWLDGDAKYDILAVDKTVETPAGTFNDVIEVQMTKGNVVKLYYAKGVGLIQVVAVMEDGEQIVQILKQMI
jgi:predicted small lipoprotein YifL